MAASATSLPCSRYICFLLLLYVFLFQHSPQKRLFPTQHMDSRVLYVARDSSQPKISNLQFSKRSSSCKTSKQSMTNRELAVTGCRLARSASFALLLVSLAGDVSSNPGPIAPPSLSVRDFTRFRGLKVAHLNMRSVYPKLDLLKLWLLNQPFDVFTVSETWLKPSITDNEIQIPGYSCVRSDQLHKTGMVLWPMFEIWPMFEMVYLIELDPILALLYLNLVPSKSLDLNARN